MCPKHLVAAYSNLDYSAYLFFLNCHAQCKSSFSWKLAAQSTQTQTKRWENFDNNLSVSLPFYNFTTTPVSLLIANASFRCNIQPLESTTPVSSLIANASFRCNIQPLESENIWKIKYLPLYFSWSCIPNCRAWIWILHKLSDGFKTWKIRYLPISLITWQQRGPHQSVRSNFTVSNNWTQRCHFHYYLATVSQFCCSLLQNGQHDLLKPTG